MSSGELQVNLQQYPKSWKLAPYGKAFTKQDVVLMPVRSAFGPAMLKQATKGKNLSTSSSLLHWYGGAGSARILKKRKDVQLIEWIDGASLAELADNAESPEAIDALGDVIQKLHAPKPAPLKTRLSPLSSLMRPLLEQRFSNDPLMRHGARLIRHLLTTMETQTPLHGDLQFNKVLHHSKRGWLTISPLGLNGDPHYELASALCAPGKQSDFRRARLKICERATRFSDRLSLNKDRLLTFAFCHACLQTILAERQDGDALHWHDMSIMLLDCLGE